MSAEDTVSGFISDQASLADQLAGEAMNLTSRAASALAGITVLRPIPDGPDGINVPDFTVPSGPDLRGDSAISVEAPAFEGELLAPWEVEVQTPTIDEPTLSDQQPGQVEAPSGTVNPFTETVPDIDFGLEDIPFPDLQTFEPLELYTPSLTEHDFNIDIPVFNAQRPEFLGTTPTDLKAQFNQAYEGQLTAVRGYIDTVLDSYMSEYFPGYQEQVAKLEETLCAIVDGDRTAWSDTTQRRVYELAKTQTDAEHTARDEEIRETLARGGSVLEFSASASLEQLGIATHQNNALASLNVAEKRADREVQFLQFALSSIQSNRQMAVNAYLGYSQQVLNSNEFALRFAEDCLGAVKSTHDIAIERYNADLNSYQTEANVYEARIKYAFSSIEQARLEIEFEKAKSDFNQSRINELEAQLNQQDQLVRVYIARITARGQELEQRALPLQVFNQKINAHEAYLSGRKVETDIYRALLDGEKSVTDHDLAKIQAYKTQWEAFGTEVEAKARFNDSRSTYNKTLSEIYRTELIEFEAKLRKQTAQVELDQDFNRMVLQKFQAELAAETARFDAELSSETQFANMRATYDGLIIQRAIESMRVKTEQAAKLAEVNVKGSEVLANLAAGIAASNGANVSLINQTTQTE